MASRNAGRVRRAATRIGGLTLGLLLVLASASGAQVAQVLPGLTTGFANDPALTNPPLIGETLSTQNFWMQKAAGLGAGVIRVNVSWQSVAPTQPSAAFAPTNPASPGYDWTTIDQDVRSIEANGMQPMLMLYLAPRWAEGPSPPPGIDPGSWEPDPTQFAAFATAAAIRYSGNFPDPLNPGSNLPKVHYWQAWNEPNLAYYLSPLWTPSGEPNSPVLYRALLNAFYMAVKAVDPTNFVLSAGTSPAGDAPTVVWPGGQRMPPLVFYRSLFCVTPQLKATTCPGPVYLDGIDHHPYQIPPPQFKAAKPDNVVVPDIWKITRLLKAGLALGSILPNVPKQEWVGEITWDTNPPSLNGIAAPLADQACYVELAMYLLWKQGVNTVLWLQLRDWAPMPPWQATFRWGGMYFYSGAPKPSATAFRFPLVAWRLNRKHIEVWSRAPAKGLLTFRTLESGDRESGDRWVRVATIPVAAGQVSLTTLTAQAVDVEASVAGSTSLPWTSPTATCLSH